MNIHEEHVSILLNGGGDKKLHVMMGTVTQEHVDLMFLEKPTNLKCLCVSQGADEQTHHLSVCVCV